MKLDEKRCTMKADVMMVRFFFHLMGDKGRSYAVKDFISLTSDGTIADRRGEGHHFIVGGVKQA